MLLAEVLARKEEIDSKIDILENHLRSMALDDSIKDTVELDKIVSNMYELFDERQQHIFTIDRANSSIEVKIGNSKTTLASAIRLRETVERKIDVLSELIKACENNTKSGFSVIELLNNKDKLLAEYNVLTNAISKKDWTVELDE